MGKYNMLKTLMKHIGSYKKDSIITPIFTASEVFLEILIPFVTASIIDKGIEAGDMNNVYKYGAIMLVLAFLSLFCNWLHSARFGHGNHVFDTQNISTLRSMP